MNMENLNFGIWLCERTEMDIANREFNRDSCHESEKMPSQVKQADEQIT